MRQIRRNIQLLASVFLLLAVLLLSGCGSSRSGTPTTSVSSVPSPASTPTASRATPAGSALPQIVTAGGIAVTLGLVDSTSTATRFYFSIKLPADVVDQQFGNVLGQVPANDVNIDGITPGPNDPYVTSTDHGPGQPTMSLSLDYQSAFPSDRRVTLTISHLWLPTSQVDGPWVFTITPKMVASQPSPTPATDLGRFAAVSVAEAQKLVGFPITEPNPLPAPLVRKEFNVNGYALGVPGTAPANYVMLDYEPQQPSSEQGVMVVETTNDAAVPTITDGSASILWPSPPAGATRTMMISPGTQTTLTIDGVRVTRFEVADATARTIYYVWKQAGVGYFVQHHETIQQSSQPLVTDDVLKQVVTSMIDRVAMPATPQP